MRVFRISEELRLRLNQSAAECSVAPHQLEKTNCVAHRMNLAHLIGVNGANRNGFDPVTLAAGDDEHFSFIIEAVRTAKHLGE